MHRTYASIYILYIHTPQKKLTRHLTLTKKSRIIYITNYLKLFNYMQIAKKRKYTTNPANPPGPKGPSKYTPDVIDKICDELLKYTEQTQNPTIEEFAFLHKVPRETLYADIQFKNHQRFSNTFKIIRPYMGLKWLKNGADGKMPPAIAIFASKNMMHWTDRIDLQHNGISQSSTVNLIKIDVLNQPVDKVVSSLDGVLSSTILPDKTEK